MRIIINGAPSPPGLLRGERRKQRERERERRHQRKGTNKHTNNEISRIIRRRLSPFSARRSHTRRGYICIYLRRAESINSTSSINLEQEEEKLFHTKPTHHRRRAIITLWGQIVQGTGGCCPFHADKWSHVSDIIIIRLPSVPPQRLRLLTLVSLSIPVFQPVSHPTQIVCMQSIRFVSHNFILGTWEAGKVRERGEINKAEQIMWEQQIPMHNNTNKYIRICTNVREEGLG